jgi:hypothetical protein
MREEIRLGNEALARNDIETAKQYFQQILVTDGTPLQKRIAANRLREIQERAEVRLDRAPSPSRTRRKSTGGKKSEGDSTPHRVIRPPDKPLIVIRKH